MVEDEGLLCDDVNLFEYEEEVVVPEGTECEFTVFDAKKKSNANGTKWLEVGLQLRNEEFSNIKSCYARLFYPSPTDDKKKKNIKIGFFKRFANAIGYHPEDGVVRPEELLGKEGSVIVKKIESDEYGDKNEPKKFIQPVVDDID